MAVRGAPRSHGEGQYWPRIGIGAVVGPPWLGLGAAGSQPRPPPPSVLLDAKSEEIHKDSFPALTLRAFV